MAKARKIKKAAARGKKSSSAKSKKRKIDFGGVKKISRETLNVYAAETNKKFNLD